MAEIQHANTSFGAGGSDLVRRAVQQIEGETTRQAADFRDRVAGWITERTDVGRKQIRPDRAAVAAEAVVGVLAVISSTRNPSSGGTGNSLPWSGVWYVFLPIARWDLQTVRTVTRDALFRPT